MMRKTLMFLCLFLALSPLAAGMVGCGGSSGPVTPAESDMPVTGPEPEPGEEPTLPEEGP